MGIRSVIIGCLKVEKCRNTSVYPTPQAVLVLALVIRSSECKIVISVVPP